MADEIVILEIGSPEDERGRVSFNALFVFDIDPEIEINGATFAPTPSNQLPTRVVEFNIFSNMEMKTFDDGVRMFQLLRFDRLPGASQQATLDKIEVAYNARKLVAVSEEREKVALFGTKLSP